MRTSNNHVILREAKELGTADQLLRFSRDDILVFS